MALQVCNRANKSVGSIPGGRDTLHADNHQQAVHTISHEVAKDKTKVLLSLTFFPQYYHIPDWVGSSEGNLLLQTIGKVFFTGQMPFLSPN